MRGFLFITISLLAVCVVVFGAENVNESFRPGEIWRDVDGDVIHAHGGGVIYHQGYYTFGLLWTPDEYVFYVDGRETWRTSAGGVSQVPEYIKLSEEIGPWGGDIKKANLPDYFIVDHVRVYDVVD